MDASLTATADLSYAGAPPILIAASSDLAARRAEATVQACGLRTVDPMGVDEALERLPNQARASAIWLEIDRDCGRSMDQLLHQIGHDVGAGRYAAIVSTNVENIDPIMSAIGDADIDLLVDGDEPARIASLALASAKAAMPARLMDVAADRNTERLRQLSDEVGRIAATLARLSTGPAPAAPMVETVHAGEAGPVSADTVRSVIRARRLRARFFSEELFADPAWDMLLDLLQAEISHLRVPVSSLCIAAAVPATTALRWLKTMVSQGIFIRRADPHDGRRVFVELAPETSQALRRYFAEVEKVAVI